MTGTFEKSYSIEADIELVWECLTDEETCGLWQGGDCTIGTSPGDRVVLFNGSVLGKILEISQESLLKFTWRGSGWQEDWDDSIVTYKLLQEGDMVIVEVSHENFPNQDEFESHSMGWDTYFFEPMTEFIAQSK